VGTAHLFRTSGPLVGQSPQMARLFELIRRAAASQFPVFILGEPGTGKSLVAEAIHGRGPRCNELFVPIHCAALSSMAIGSELFGYVPGINPEEGGEQGGLLGYAKEGTLFLDEIPALPSELQARLLGAIEQRAFRPLGSASFQPFGARVLAATNQDLESVLRDGSLRKDLYYRLNVISICVPPLRERKRDISLLACHILKRLCSNNLQNSATEVPVLSRDAMEVLMGHEWPGNVRELENCLERVVASGYDQVVHAKDISLDHRLSILDPKLHSKDQIVPLKELERHAILRAVSANDGDKMTAARLLGIGKTTLYRKLDRYRDSQL